MEYCKIGKIKFGRTIKILENCERFGMKTKEPSCYFTNGFLNGFFYKIRDQRVRETKCIGMRNKFCEWEFTSIKSNS